MGFEEIRIAIETRVARWDDVPVLYDGHREPDAVKAAREAKQSWVRCTIQHGDSFPASISNRPETRRPGLIQFQIFAPNDQGSRPAAIIADSLADHFEYWFDGRLSTQAASVQRVSPDAGWYQYNVTVPFSNGY